MDYYYSPPKKKKRKRKLKWRWSRDAPSVYSFEGTGGSSPRDGPMAFRVPLLLSQTFIMVIGMTFLIEKFQRQFRKLDILRNNGTYLRLDNHSSTLTDGPDWWGFLKATHRTDHEPWTIVLVIIWCPEIMVWSVDQ